MVGQEFYGNSVLPLRTNQDNLIALNDRLSALADMPVEHEEIGVGLDGLPDLAQVAAVSNLDATLVDGDRDCLKVIQFWRTVICNPNGDVNAAWSVGFTRRPFEQSGRGVNRRAARSGAERLNLERAVDRFVNMITI